MNDSQKQVLTQEGYEKLVKEIEEREGGLRNKIADDIERARQQGDLSENAAYKAALEAKEFNEVRISDLKELLANSSIASRHIQGIVGVGSEIELERRLDKARIKYFIVGHNEANPREGKITLDSPVGSALEGAKLGEYVQVKTPAGVTEYLIVSLK